MTVDRMMGGTFSVLEGRDGWLFIDTEDELEVMRLYTDPSYISKDVINAWCLALRARREYFESLGITHLTVIGPGAHLVYPDVLPSGVTLSGQSPFTVLDQGLDESTAAEVLYLLDPLVEARASSPTFVQTDSHWADWGAFTGYTATMRRLSTMRDDLRILEEDDVRWSTKQFSGALGAVMPEPRSEYIRSGDVRGSRCVHTTHIKNDLREGFRVVEQDRPELPSAVIFRDSSMTNAQKFFSESFRRTVYTSHANSVFRDLVERERPDVVLTVMGERRLAMPPRDGTTDDFRLMFGDLLTDNPEGIEAQVASRSSLRSGDPDGALVTNQVALDVRDQAPQNWWGIDRRGRLLLHRSHCHADLGNLAAAVECLREATLAAPGDGPIWLAYGKLLQDTDQNAEAVTAYTQATSVEPQNPVVWTTAIHRLLDSGHTAEVALLGGRAAELHPRDPVIRHANALALAEDDSLDEAVDELRVATSIAPTVIAYRQSLASVLLRLGLWVEAEMVLEELVVDAPEQAEYADLLAWAQSHIVADA